MFDVKIIPLYHEDILAEYDEVLHRNKFHFKEETIQLFINAVKQYGIEVFPQPTGEILVDMDEKYKISKIHMGCGQRTKTSLRETIIACDFSGDVLEGVDEFPVYLDL